MEGMSMGGGAQKAPSQSAAKGSSKGGAQGTVINAKVANIAKETLIKTVKAMTPEECLRVMPGAMSMFGGNTPQMQAMMKKGKGMGGAPTVSGNRPGEASHYKMGM